MGDRRDTFDSIPPAHGRVIEGLSPDMSGAKAILRSVGGRLRAVDELLPLVVEKADVDVRTVHRLRVSTRRAAAAIRAFKGSLPKKSGKRALQVLKDIRSAASVARASDVDLAVLADVTDSAPADQSMALAFIQGVVAHERSVAAASLSEHCHGRNARSLRKVGARLCRECAKSDAANLDFLTIAERAVESQFEKAVAASQANLHDIDELHQLRIECKRLRYTLEAIGPCADQLGWTPLYDVLVESQDQFGAVNDAHELAARIDRVRAEYTTPPFEPPPGLVESLNALSAAQFDRAKAAHAAFLHWWEASELKAALMEHPAPPDAAQDGQSISIKSRAERTPEETKS